MGALMVISLGVFLLTGFPLLSYLCAREKGRNPKTWLLLGIVLPGISTLILTFLPDKSKEQSS